MVAPHSTTEKKSVATTDDIEVASDRAVPWARELDPVPSYAPRRPCLSIPSSSHWTLRLRVAHSWPVQVAAALPRSLLQQERELGPRHP
jgi:hypothetical protein